MERPTLCDGKQRDDSSIMGHTQAVKFRVSDEISGVRQKIDYQLMARHDGGSIDVDLPI